MNRRVVFVAGGIAMMFLIAGCLQQNKAPEDPEKVAEEALKTFGSALDSGEGGKIKRIDADFEIHGSDAGAMGFGSGSFQMLIEWGTSDVVHVQMAMNEGGFSLQADAWCSADGTILRWGNDVYQSRPTTEPSEGELCGASEDFSEMGGDGMSLLGSEEFGDVNITSVDTHSDGSITAAFETTEHGELTEGTAEIDAKGRLRKLTMSSEEASGTFEITYGKRSALEAPEPTGKLPADASWSTDYEDQAKFYTFYSSPHQPPLDEMEARITDYDWENDEETMLAQFPLDAGTGSDNGYQFEFHDADGDGRLTENDTLLVTFPAGQDPWSGGDLDLYDEWAGVMISESPLPAPGVTAFLALGSVALVGVAAARRRV